MQMRVFTHIHKFDKAAYAEMLQDKTKVISYKDI